MLTFYVNKVLQNIESSFAPAAGIKVEVREPNLFDRTNAMLPPHILESLGMNKRGEITVLTENKRSFVIVVEELADRKWDNYDVIMMHTPLRQKLGVTIGSYIYLEKKG